MIRRLVGVLGLLLTCSPLGAQGIFRDTVPLQVTLVTDLKAVIRDRDSTKFKPHGATLTYLEPNGTPRTFPVTLRARGHFRRQSRNCDFPPLKLEFERADARGTLFQGNDEMKITTNCRAGNADFEQYVLGEYAMYRAYQLVSPRYFRTRLARITYKDSTSKMPDVVSWAFFIEEDKEVAKRYSLKIEETKGALFSDLDDEQLAISAMFEFMVANTDWSISGLHNVSLMRDSVGRIHPVLFDFDWSGAVNTRYSFPDTRLGIRATTDRLYRGPCKPLPEWQPTITRFTAARPRIEATLAAIPSLEPRRLRSTTDFFSEFYRIIGDQRTLKNTVGATCLPDGN